MRIYLDQNATTRLHPEVLDVMLRAWRDAYGNPGSRHAEGREARKVLEESRESIARILDAEPDELVFTSGGTESANLALAGLAARGGVPGTILLTGGEHPATRETCRELSTRGWKLADLPLNSNGLFEAAEIDRQPWAEIRLASVILAHNETGVIQNVAPLAEQCLANNIPLHLDGVQAVGKIPVSFRELRATTLSFGAHKFHGPRGVGGLLVRNGTKLIPKFWGGGQEGGLRPGTEPVALIAGMARALELWKKDEESRTAHLLALRDELEQALKSTCAPAIVHGEGAPRLPNTLCIGFPEISGEALLVSLDLEGIACSLGSACASGSTEPAPVLLAMGVSRELALASLRLSVGVTNTRPEIVVAARKIEAAVRRLRSSWSYSV